MSKQPDDWKPQAECHPAVATGRRGAEEASESSSTAAECRPSVEQEDFPVQALEVGPYQRLWEGLPGCGGHLRSGANADLLNGGLTEGTVSVEDQ
ncbi:hypothetical protein GCM10017776_59960 [Streptomyces griseoluteus]|nr:hypothetical protein GCM10017776_59960 [Streptomyces griseoluteus]